MGNSLCKMESADYRPEAPTIRSVIAPVATDTLWRHHHQRP
jgi:hypothetical protein